MTTNPIPSYKKPVEHGVPVHVELEGLPPGSYYYFFSIVNPFAQSFEIECTIPAISNCVYRIKDQYKYKNLYLLFEVAEKQAFQSLQLNFNLLAGYHVFLTLTQNPQFKTGLNFEREATVEVMSLTNHLLIADEKVRDEVVMQYRPVDVYHRIFKDVQQGVRVNANAVNSNMTAPIFYELVNTKEAIRQMDYVIYNKVLAPAPGNIFKRFFRSILRGLIQGVYKLLTRNPNRKHAIGKLYRNYLNINFISEKK